MEKAASNRSGDGRLNMLVGPVGPTIVRLAAPMVLGIAAIILFNVVDTLFVSQLGKTELTAMSFTFPVVFVITSLALGIGIGTTSVVARAIGSGDSKQVRRLTTHSLLLSLVLVGAFAAVGLLTIEPLFAALGATAPQIALISDYMVPYYLGVGLLVVPMIGNAAIRATGDTKTPSIIMIIVGLVNAVLDPLLIFGLGPFPRLELQGAALATIISYGASLVVGLWLLSVRLGLIEWSRPRIRAVLRSWGQVLYIGVPAAAANMLVPISAGILTRILAGIDHESVAAYGVASRIESVAMVGVFALTTAVAPFIGQNHGAGHVKRVVDAVRFSFRASMVLGAGTAVLLALTSASLARVFTDDPQVMDGIVTFMATVPISYGALGLSMLLSSCLNAVNRPLLSSMLIGVRLFVLVLPCAYLGGHMFGTAGVFAGVCAANLGIGLVAWLVARHVFSEERTSPAAALAA